MKLVMLGCGTSTGVPRIGNDWGECDPNEQKNRRTRVSILVESNEVLRLEAFQGIGQILPGAFGVKRRRVRRRGDDRHNAEWLSCPSLRRAAPANAGPHDGCRFPGADALETATPQPGQKRASGISPRPH